MLDIVDFFVKYKHV